MLLLVLLIVAVAAWQDRYRSTRWREPLFVAVYPIAADSSMVTRTYVAALDGARFADIGHFFSAQAAGYHLKAGEPIRIRLQPALDAPPPPAPDRCPRRRAELMAGRRLLTATRWEQVSNLEEVAIGPATALEIRWLQSGR